jgi:fumarate reductase subunit D
MPKSNKPIIWGPFAAGGTITALLTPVLILLTLLAALGQVPPGLAYDELRAFASHPLAKGLIFVVLGFSLWSAAHRLRITFYDFGLRQDSLVAAVVYLAAAIGTIVLIASLWVV